ncbi:MAG TPA: pyrroline-5-carboxylate reductase dimerization domain-containing protein [Candidatus Saccharimonadales bacterium]
MKTVAIIGFGTMGRAIAKTLDDSYKIIELDRGDDLSRINGADFVILAVKPQAFSELSEAIRPFLDQQLVISIMAGIQCRRIREGLGIRSLVRTMPNLGVATGSSVTGAYVFGEADKAVVADLLEHWGRTIWLEKESDFDGFTAVAGCGPAYFFELTYQLQNASEKLGFKKELARQIANATLASAASALANESAAEKVAQVASKGGATEAALKVLDEHQYGQIIDQAVQAARIRSQELSDG